MPRVNPVGFLQSLLFLLCIVILFFLELLLFHRYFIAQTIPKADSFVLLTRFLNRYLVACCLLSYYCFDLLVTATTIDSRYNV